MSTDPDGDPSLPSDSPRPDAAGQSPDEAIPLPPEPSYEVADVAEVVRAICWWCGDPETLNQNGLCPSCVARKAQRDRERGWDEDTQRAREESRRRKEYDYEYDARPDEEEEEHEDGWHSATGAHRRREDDEEMNWWGPLQGGLVFFGILMIVSVGWGASLLSKNGVTQDDVLRGTATVEVLDAIIVLIALGVVSRKAMPARTSHSRSVAWAFAVPVFGILIGLNVLYTSYLRQLLGGDAEEPGLTLTGFTLLLICVQPALVEELFFRYVLFGAFHRAAGLHATVWITGMMFAVSHIYNPLAVPYLFLAGVVFGYARVWGGLLLPMILHFFHNLAVLAIASA
jgi:membrane protease YdiL (CAAX protease family)